MAWLKLTDPDGRETLVNIDQATEIYRTKFGTDVVTQRRVATFRESVDEIAAMIADAERRERLDGMFKAIVYNFPQGYDPAEIVETARRLLDALDTPRES